MGANPSRPWRLEREYTTHSCGQWPSWCLNGRPLGSIRWLVQPSWTVRISVHQWCTIDQPAKRAISIRTQHNEHDSSPCTCLHHWLALIPTTRTAGIENSITIHCIAWMTHASATHASGDIMRPVQPSWTVEISARELFLFDYNVMNVIKVITLARTTDWPLF